MATCTLIYDTNGGTGSIENQSTSFIARSDGSYYVTFTLDDGSGISYEGYHLKSWVLSDYASASTGTEYELGEEITINSSSNVETTYYVVAKWEWIYPITYVYSPEDAESGTNRNPTEYYESMGEIPLYPPVVNSSYRFDHWEYNGVKVSSLSPDLLASTSITLVAICKVETKIGIYGREIQEVSTIAEDKENRYILMTSSLKPDTARVLSGSSIGRFFLQGHSYSYYDIDSEATQEVSCDSIISEVYVNTSSDTVNLDLVSTDRSDTQVLLHIIHKESYVNQLEITLQIGEDTQTYTTTYGVVKILVNTDSSGATTTNLIEYPIGSLFDFITESISTMV